uniref:Secreted protein n=1 Tax=Cacopsylla melanoneura TaxID=428564 RepID=A0A8D8XDW7_9HEMI
MFRRTLCFLGQLFLGTMCSLGQYVSWDNTFLGKICSFLGNFKKFKMFSFFFAFSHSSGVGSLFIQTHQIYTNYKFYTNDLLNNYDPECLFYPRTKSSSCLLHNCTQKSI